MFSSNTYRVGVLSLDVLLLIVCLWHLPTLAEKPRVPFDIRHEPAGVTVRHIVDDERAGGLRQGDVIRQWSETRVEFAEVLEFLGDLSSVGEQVALTFERDGMLQSTRIELVEFNDSPLRYILITLFVGIVVWGIGVFVLINRSEDRIARTLHWAMIFFSGGLLLTWGKISFDSIETYISRALFLVTYAGAVCWLLYFALLFPRPKPFPAAVMKAVAFGPSSLLLVPMAYYQLNAISTISVDRFATFQGLFDIFHLVVLLNGALGLLAVAHSLRQAESDSERRRIRWVLWGLIVGTVPFMTLIVLPQLFGPGGIVPEEFTTIFLLAVPLTMALSVVRYRTFDIEVALNRGVVYSVLSLLIAATYSLAVLLVTSVIGGAPAFEEYFVLVLATLLVAAAFNPVREKIQKVVDEALFPARASFGKIVRSLTDQLRSALSSDSVFEQLVHGLSVYIDASFIGGYAADGSKFVVREGVGSIAVRQLEIPGAVLARLQSAGVIVRQNAVRGYSGEDGGVAEWLQHSGAFIVAALRTREQGLVGLLLIGAPSTARRFEEDEYELVFETCNIASEVLSMLLLQERVFLEKEENRRLQELGQMKTFFVSSVSHELRIPLTSIRMFAETLRLRPDVGKRKRAEYLEIIEGESERLARLIENVLDFSKIERGIKEYHFARTDVAKVVRRSVSAVQYQFQKSGGKLGMRVPRRKLLLNADADALEEALINLLSNALKYSTSIIDVAVSVHADHSQVRIEVKDKGPGIPDSERERIFDPFYRVRAGSSAHVGGAGLGLALVKHIAQAHHGDITFASKPGKGTTFILSLPRSR